MISGGPFQLAHSTTIVSLDARKSNDISLFMAIFRIYRLLSNLWWKVYRLALGLCFLKDFSGKNAKDWYCILLRLPYWNHPTLWNIHRHLKQIMCCKHNCSGSELHLAWVAQACIPPINLPGLGSNAGATIWYKGVILIRCRILSAHTITLPKMCLWGV